MTDPAPTPWNYNGVIINDANNKLIAIVAHRLFEEETVVAEIVAAREMHELLIAVEDHLATALPDGLLLDEVRAMLVRLGGDR